MNKEEIVAQSIFPTMLYFTSLNISTDKEKILLEAEKGSSVSNKKGWQSEKYTQSTLPKSLEEIINKTHSVVSLVYKNLGIQKKPELSNCWLNVSGPDAYNKKHKHPQSLMSAIFYLNFPEGANGVIFHRPDILSDYFGNLSNNEKCGTVFETSPKDNDLIVFPSYLEHSVDASENIKEDRISVAMNFK